MRIDTRSISAVKSANLIYMSIVCAVDMHRKAIKFVFFGCIRNNVTCVRFILDVNFLEIFFGEDVKYQIHFNHYKRLKI